jgi:hypothetical protein
MASPAVSVAATAIMSSADFATRQLRAALRNLPANGSRIKPRAMGKELFSNGLPYGVTAALLGKVTVSVTFVAPAPAGIGLGLNVAVAPEGNPETLSWIAAGNVEPPEGANGKVNTACPPGEAVTDVLPPAPVPIDNVSIASLTALLVTATKFESPEYAAVIGCDPAVRVDVVNVAAPPLRVAFPSAVVPS